jgi:hypothetical protein
MHASRRLSQPSTGIELNELEFVYTLDAAGAHRFAGALNGRAPS